MTYDDVADIKAALQVMVLLLERMAESLDNIDECVVDIANRTQPEDA